MQDYGQADSYSCKLILRLVGWRRGPDPMQLCSHSGRLGTLGRY